MKTHHISKHIVSRLLVLMVAMLYFAPAFAQDSQQHAIYNYRNDGDFNAWLDIDVEKITYSCTDLDGVEHDDIVVQEVWTPDSVYRIPINAIDSIGFRAPKPEMKEGIFHITEDHLPYAVSVEDLTVTFRSSIPSSMLPSVGQVVISDVFDSPFEEGFSGKVESISNNNGQITIICSQAAPNEVFKKLVLVGKGVSEYDANSKATNMHGAPRKAWTDPLIGYQAQGFYSNIEMPAELKLELLGGIFEVKSKNPTMTVSYCFYIDDLTYSFAADAFLNHKDLSYTVAFKLSDFLKVGQTASEYFTNFILGKGDEKKAEKEWYEHEYDDIKLKIPFNIGPVIFSFEVAPVFKLKGDVELDLVLNTSARQHIGFKKSGSTPLLMLNPITSLALGDLNYGYNQDPVSVKQLTAKAEGSATLGISLQLQAHVLNKNLIQASVGAEYDREAKGTLQLNLYDSENQPTSFYDVIKDTKVEVKDYVKIKGEIGTLKYLTLEGSFKIPTKEWGTYNIVPHFTKPELPAYTNGVWTFRNPFSLYSTVSKDVLVSCKPGLRIEDNDGNLEKEYTSTEPYQYETAWELTPLEIDISDLTPDKSYKCYPTFSMFGLKPFKATPVAEFTVPQPVSLETTTITVQKDKAQRVAINGGWGDYSVIVLDKSVCTAELKQDGDSYYIQIVGKKDGGSTSVTLKDLRSQKTAAVLVSVTNEVVQKLIKVEPKEIDFGQVEVGSSKSATFTVSNMGTASLTVTVASGLDEGDDCVLAGSGQQFTLAVGQSKTFTVTYTPTQENSGFNAIIRILSDAENGTEIVTVSGRSYKATVDPVGTETITVNGVSFTMVGVDGGTFWMGSPDDDSDADNDERPRHQVTLSSFAIGQTEVTQELWEAVMGSNPSWFKGGSLPVEEVSWNDCQEFLTKLNALTGRSFRLPTEAEWEYAARGGQNSRGYKYSGSDDIGAVAWYSSNSGSTTHAVGTKAPNELGLYDMSGNVWEWCQDWWGSNYYANSPSDNPCDDTSGFSRVYRGGSWDFSARYCRVAYRNSEDPDYQYEYLGLRLALSGGGSTEQTYTSCPDNHHPHLIDLGLPSGTKWACCNVGASKPEEYGGYFAWGETSEKSSYTEDNYLDGKDVTTNIGSNIAGTNYDVAFVKWGSEWVMPNLSQIEELLDNCAFEWITLNGVCGSLVTASNGKTIFLPAAGNRFTDSLQFVGERCYYWSSSLNPIGTYYAYISNRSWDLKIESGKYKAEDGRRDMGQPVRPVRKN